MNSIYDYPSPEDTKELRIAMEHFITPHTEIGTNATAPTGDEYKTYTTGFALPKQVPASSKLERPEGFEEMLIRSHWCDFMDMYERVATPSKETIYWREVPIYENLCTFIKQVSVVTGVQVRMRLYMSGVGNEFAVPVST